MDIELDGHSYQLGKIDARSQFHIVRRLAPILGEIGPALQGGKDGFTALPLIAEAISKLSDVDADYCIFGLLKTVKRKQQGGLGWGPVATDGTLMYSDITMKIMLKLAWESLSFNMSGFFAGLPSALTEATQKVSEQ